MIDDDQELSGMVGRYLAPFGIELTSRPEAESALALLRRGGFEAVILDVMLPDLDGLEVCRRISATSELPVLMLTARGDEEDRIVGLELGADDYLPKPFIRPFPWRRRRAARGCGTGRSWSPAALPREALHPRPRAPARQAAGRSAGPGPGPASRPSR